MTGMELPPGAVLASTAELVAALAVILGMVALPFVVRVIVAERTRVHAPRSEAAGTSATAAIRHRRGDEAWSPSLSARSR
jgi:predicted cobalt transporter CbtA